MFNNKSNNVVEDKIEQYINGNLSADEVDDLWAELIQNGYRLDYLKSMANLNEVAGKKHEEKKMHLIQQRWSYVAAVMVLLIVSVVGIIKYTGSSQKATIQPVKTVELGYYRSNNGMISSNQHAKIINHALTLVNQGKKAEAKSLLRKRLKQAGSAQWVAKLNLNLGSISYNEGDYNKAIDYYDQVIKDNSVAVLTLEKAYWYKGNAYFQLDSLGKAKVNIQKAYDQNGAYRRVAKRYLDALKKRID